MAKDKPRNNKFFVISIITLSVLLVSIVVLNIMIINKTNDIELEIEKYRKEEENLKKTVKFISNSNDVGKKEIDDLNNIEERITQTRKDIFVNAKKLEDQILSGISSKKIAYITFDDGPYYLTNNVLDVLRNYGVKATFFTIGLDKDVCFDNRGASCAGMYKRIVDEGHTIANHTYSHLIKRGLYASVDSFIYNIDRQENLIKERTGVITNITRFPGGSGTAGSLRNGIIERLKQKGYGWVDWTALDGDGGALSTQAQAMSNFVNSINSNIEVVLLHDYNYITYYQLPEMIKYLKNQGYILLPLFYESNMINK